MSAQTFRISPLIRYSLYGLYGSLTLPLPFLLARQAKLGWVVLLCLGLMVGLVALVGALSQRVEVDERGIAIVYPAWVPGWLRREWQLAWSEMSELYASSTSQGGLAYYLGTQLGRRYLLPMRIRGFRQLLARIQSETGIETRMARPFVQPWMYLALAVCSGILLLWDGLVIALVVSSHG